MRRIKTRKIVNPLVVSFLPERNGFVRDLNGLFYKGLQEGNSSFEWIIVDNTKISYTRNAKDPFEGNIFRRRIINENRLNAKIANSNKLIFILPFCLSEINLRELFEYNDSVKGATFICEGEECLITHLALLNELPNIFNHPTFIKDKQMKKIFDSFSIDFFDPVKIIVYVIIILDKDDEEYHKYYNTLRIKQKMINENSISIMQRIYELGHYI